MDRIDRLRRFYQTPIYRYAFWLILVLLLVLANWALRHGNHLLLLGMASVGAVIGAVSIYVERINFRRGESFEPAYTTRVMRPVALLAVSLSLAVLSLIWMLDL